MPLDSLGTAERDAEQFLAQCQSRRFVWTLRRVVEVEVEVEEVQLAPDKKWRLLSIRSCRHIEGVKTRALSPRPKRIRRPGIVEWENLADGNFSHGTQATSDNPMFSPSLCSVFQTFPSSWVPLGHGKIMEQFQISDNGQYNCSHVRLN